jgi:hypothetical protein
MMILFYYENRIPWWTNCCFSFSFMTKSDWRKYFIVLMKLAPPPPFPFEIIPGRPKCALILIIHLRIITESVVTPDDGIICLNIYIEWVNIFICDTWSSESWIWYHNLSPRVLGDLMNRQYRVSILMMPKSCFFVFFVCEA